MARHTAESRRAFLKTTALAGAALGGRAALGQANSVEAEKTVPAFGKLRIKLAGYQYDRVEGLVDDRVQIEGCETQFEVARIGEMNTHLFSGPKTREVTEIGLLPFILAFANEDFRDYTLIPVSRCESSATRASSFARIAALQSPRTCAAERLRPPATRPLR